MDKNGEVNFPEKLVRIENKLCFLPEKPVQRRSAWRQGPRPGPGLREQEAGRSPHSLPQRERHLGQKESTALGG